MTPIPVLLSLPIVGGFKGYRLVPLPRVYLPRSSFAIVELVVILMVPIIVALMLIPVIILSSAQASRDQ